MTLHTIIPDILIIIIVAIFCHVITAERSVTNALSRYVGVSCVN